MSSAPLLFLSYASPDRERVLPYCDWLGGEGFEVWLDVKRLLPGQNWDLELRSAIDRATLVVAFISASSVDRRGYVQRELRLALDRQQERLSDDIYIIPVLLDDVPLPDALKHIQGISSSDPDCRAKILASLHLQLGRLGHQVQRLQSEAKLSWSKTVDREEWDGLPGYRFELEYLDFVSDDYPRVTEVSALIRGAIVSAAFSQREAKLDQSPDLHNFGQSKSWRTNEYDAHCGLPAIKNRVLTVQYAIHWYYAGAAHPNYGFSTFSFLLDPLVRIPSLAFVFKDEAAALTVVQGIVRKQLLEPREISTGEFRTLDERWVNSGTETWDHLGSFVFGDKEVEVLFAPYQVAPYVDGPQFAKLEYERIVHLLKPVFVTALGLEGIRHAP